jgi:hypothetical protein|tara:strand:+ start:1280 stop:1417 length:138 start_codon:yes stop_codon:yes gene_type:complete
MAKTKQELEQELETCYVLIQALHEQIGGTKSKYYRDYDEYCNDLD